MEKLIKEWITRQQALINALARKNDEGTIVASNVIRYWREEILDLHKQIRYADVDKLNQDIKKNNPFFNESRECYINTDTHHDDDHHDRHNECQS